jgi:hypothetical protein
MLLGRLSRPRAAGAQHLGRLWIEHGFVLPEYTQNIVDTYGLHDPLNVMTRDDYSSTGSIEQTVIESGSTFDNETEKARLSDMKNVRSLIVKAQQAFGK